MRVIPLGTSSAVPTLRRGLSSVALVREGEVFLFDCGEGTQLQYHRAALKPGRLTRIFISHLHGDHLFGLIGLLTTLQMIGRTRPLHVYGPRGLAAYVDFLRKLSGLQFNFDLPIREFGEGFEGVLCDERDFLVEAKPLEHRVFTLGFRFAEKPKPGKFDVAKADALGVPFGKERGMLQRGEAITLVDGRVVAPEELLGPPRAGKKIAYCVDTRPCENTIRLAQGADLLIHDGTFAAEEKAKAEARGHSTVVEAAEIARQAQVQQLLLTHVSARYEDPEADQRLLEEARRIFPNTLLAQDLTPIEV